MYSSIQTLKQYSPPLLEIYRYAVEHGFANSKVISSGNAEKWSEINDNAETFGSFTGSGGENEAGEWNVSWE